MARKKSVKKSAKDFCDAADEISTFLSIVGNGQSDRDVSWLHNYAIIKLYKEFEALMLDALIGAINNDTTTLSTVTGVSFPKHLSDEVCEFLIAGNGYFDFKGRDGLIRTLKEFVPGSHYLVTLVKEARYRDSLERLFALRNFAAHESSISKKRAIEKSAPY
jgi:hypothetical protein